MLKFLGLYLAITGGLAALAMLAPGLVVMGFFLLVLPGLALSLMPTAFLWGLVFTGLWLLARMLLGETLLTALVAGAATLALLVAVTIPEQLAGKAAYRASLLPEVTPKTRIAMRGDVRLDLPRPKWDNANTRGQRGLRGFACDKLCLSLLFTPGVTSVTINRSGSAMADVPGGGEGLNVEARSYRLVPKSQCPEGGLIPDFGWGSVFENAMADRSALDAEWRARLVDEVCLVRIETLARHDLLIRDGLHGETRHDRKTRWQLAPRGPAVTFLDITTGNGAVLLRQFQSKVLVLAWPLHIFGNGDLQSFHFDWGLKQISNRPGWYDPELIAALDTHTDTAGRASAVTPAAKL